jgi:glycosyltransferase involved in cell wall biosynthesis
MKTSGNILVLTQWSFKDALVQTYTLPYINIIREIISPKQKIFLVTAEQEHIALSKTEADQVNKEWEKKNMMLLPVPYKRFGLKKIIASAGNLPKLIGVIKKEKIKTIHAFCTPAGGIAYLLSKFTGAHLIIDSYEPHAESMIENGTWKKNGLAYKILFFLERKQTQKARVLIGTTTGMKQYALEGYRVEVKNFYVKPACVDLVKFSPSQKDPLLLKELDFENKIICVYAGKLGGIYLKEEVFDFIKLCYDRWKDDFRFLMLTSATKEEINTEMQRVKLPEKIVTSQFVYHDDVPRYLSLGDFAINPVKPVPTKRYCTSIKDGEYWAMGLPVVISPGISDDSGIIEKENAGVVVDLSDKVELARSIDKIEELLERKDELKRKIRQIAIKYRSYDLAKKIYKEIYS